MDYDEYRRHLDSIEPIESVMTETWNKKYRERLTEVGLTLVSKDPGTAYMKAVIISLTF